jgi:hypothetical protein
MIEFYLARFLLASVEKEAWGKAWKAGEQR